MRGLQQIRTHFAPEFAAVPTGTAGAIAEAVAALLSLEMVEFLRRIRGLGREETATVIGTTLGGLLPLEGKAH